MREVTLDCDVCGKRLPLEQSKEALISQGENSYHLLDLCPQCLDDQLKNATSVNDADGFRQQAAALITLRDDAVPERRAAS
jgi:hypothetical protein